jgi:broad specificity phosphatase PhoE
MTATILLVRHAAHIDLDRRLSGRRAAVRLSEEGREQAVVLGRLLAGRAVDRVESSPLDRTRDTARALIEIDMGAWTGRALDTFGDDPVWRAWNEQRGSARIPDGESMAEAQARIVGHLAATGETGGTVAMVTHSDMIRAGVAAVLGLSLDHLLRFDIDPASVTTLVWGDWGARLLSLNEKVA